VALGSAQQLPRTTPVPILKQINRHNDDGSYSYGYEGADGSFKIETKYPTGEVYGKYGYTDSDGQRREIEYGASKRGFEPVGTGITVPPPTFNNNNNNNVDNADDYDDGSYREDPRIYNEYEQQYQGANSAAVAPRPAPKARAPVAAQTYQQPQAQARQYYQPQPVANPHQNFNNFQGHPATNVNLNTGSYQISYTG
jgi:Insect cuticle protein